MEQGIIPHLRIFYLTRCAKRFFVNSAFFSFAARQQKRRRSDAASPSKRNRVEDSSSAPGAASKGSKGSSKGSGKNNRSDLELAGYNYHPGAAVCYWGIEPLLRGICLARYSPILAVCRSSFVSSFTIFLLFHSSLSFISHYHDTHSLEVYAALWITQFEGTLADKCGAEYCSAPQ